MIYAITADGVLRWHLHEDYLTGGPRWSQPADVGIEWHQFKRVVLAGNGILYAVKPNGTALC